MFFSNQVEDTDPQEPMLLDVADVFQDGDAQAFATQVGADLDDPVNVRAIQALMNQL